MREQFDKELRDHIKDTFDVFDDGLAHDGWKNYQRKLRNKKRRAFIMWSLPSGIAAAITFFLLLNINQDAPFVDETMLIAETNNIKQKTVNIPEKKEEQQENTIIKSTGVKKTSAVNSLTNSTKSVEQGKIPAAVLANIIVPVKQKTIEVYVTDSVSSDKEISLEQAIALNNEKSIIANAILPNSLFKEEEPVYSGIFDEPNSSFAYTGKKEDKSLIKKFKNVKVSIDASTFMNFTKEGVNDEVNLAVGFVSEYKLSKNFSINSGINLNRQTASFAHAMDKPLENTQNAMALTNSIASVINGHFTNAKLVGLDIPISLKFTTGGRKMNWFISTGFSSYTLLNERYLNNFSVVNYGFAGVETQNLTTEEEHTDNPFSNFQFARSLNFSTGISFPVKNITTLSIEPFIKYPLRSFGQERLSLGSGGISFKMNLNKNLFKY